MPEPIRLRVSNGAAYVWDVDDITVLRSHHHICGALTGTLPHLSQQNVFLGVPLVLMPEEVVLLLEKKLAVIVDDPSAHQEPTLPAIEKWNEERTQDVTTQLAFNAEKEAKETVSGRGTSEKALKKRREREARKEAARAIAQANGEVEEIEFAAAKSSAKPTQPVTEVPQSSTKVVLPAHTVQVAALSDRLDWYTPSLHTYPSLALAHDAGIWMYPSNLSERARCGVFRSLWEQGFFMGVGVKFGGEYLVYPGDPLRYHSHFVASVVDSPDTVIRPMEIVAHGRLGTGTKKAHLMCEWDDDNRTVNYTSIEWAGFG